MGNSEYETMEELVFSRSFRNWVLDKDSPDAGFWDDWVTRHPERLEMVHHAKAVIYALQLNLKRLSDEEIDSEVQKALQRLKDAPREIPDEPPFHPRRPGGRSRWSLRPRRLPGATPFSGRYARPLEWAALFCGICLVGYFLYRQVTPRHRDVLQSFLSSHSKEPVRQKTGDSTKDKALLLPDGSKAWLTTGSKLYYSDRLPTANGKREVYLDGEAFFDIKKNAARPFYVYTGHVITKVLGTSFRVRAWRSDPKTTVIVRTGKVSVYREEDFYTHASGNSEPGGVVLTPNQEIIYDHDREGENRRLNKTLSDNPELLAGRGAADTAMAFSGTPIKEVFRRLQNAYGIPILYDEETVASCSLFATMGNESFYDKLNIICKAIGASYEMIDGNIVVTAPGCKNSTH